MTPEIGQISLILALALAIFQGGLPLWGAWANQARCVALARPLADGQFVFAALAFAILVHAFWTLDFSVAYVAAHANSLLPLHFRIAGAWGGHEGSLLLWQLMLSGWTVAVSRLSRQPPDRTIARVIGVLGLISTGILSFTLLTSNPFVRLIPSAPDGQDLNPLLQDPGMIFHPPLLYMGYVGFSVAFAFAIAALLEGRLDTAWARWTRPWTLAAWSFLTLGIVLGSFWAYYELGWGGWWFWDAVENASFMPWLVGTALIHSLAVTEKRGSFKNWTILLAILAFSLSLLGTFLVRSGVLTSVHAFASDPRRGLYILLFLSITVGGSLTLYAWRAPKVGLGGPFALFSRESLLLTNNVFLMAMMGTVLLGTLYPLALDAFGLGKISVGPPYFEAVMVPLALPLLLLTTIGPFVAWKAGSLKETCRSLRGVGLLALLMGVCTAVIQQASWQAATGFLMAFWIILGSGLQAWQRLRAGKDHRPWQQRWSIIPASFWGMVVAHLGLGLFVLGVTMVKGTEHVRDASLQVGQSTTLADYRFEFRAITQRKGPNYLAGQATFGVYKADELIAILHPEKRYYVVQRMPMTEAAIDRHMTRDIYVSLGDTAKDGAWGVRVQIKPFMSFIWLGALLIALGGSLAAFDKRYRIHSRESRPSPQAHESPRDESPVPRIAALSPPP